MNFFLPVIAFTLFIVSMIKDAAFKEAVQVRIQIEAADIALTFGLLMYMQLVNSIETGKFIPSAMFALKMAEVFETTV